MDVTLITQSLPEFVLSFSLAKLFYSPFFLEREAFLTVSIRISSSHEAALRPQSTVNMSTEPVPYPETHEPNTKKKLQSAIQFAMDWRPEGLAGLIMWLPGDVKGDASYNHPVVILSPSISANNTVEILGVGSPGGGLPHCSRRYSED